MYKETEKQKSEIKTAEDKKDWENKKATPQPKWIIDADLNEVQLGEAYELLDSGMKVRRVALKLGVHKNKIRRKVT